MSKRRKVWLPVSGLLAVIAIATAVVWWEVAPPAAAEAATSGAGSSCAMHGGGGCGGGGCGGEGGGCAMKHGSEQPASLDGAGSCPMGTDAEHPGACPLHQMNPDQPVTPTANVPDARDKAAAADPKCNDSCSHENCPEPCRSQAAPVT